MMVNPINKRYQTKHVYKLSLDFDLFVCLFSRVLWYINLCRLFNARSIFIQKVSSISNNSEYTI